MAGWPYQTHPAGWYQIDWSKDRAPGGNWAPQFYPADSYVYSGSQEDS